VGHGLAVGSNHRGRLSCHWLRDWLCRSPRYISAASRASRPGFKMTNFQDFAPAPPRQPSVDGRFRLPIGSFPRARRIGYGAHGARYFSCVLEFKSAWRMAGIAGTFVGALWNHAGNSAITWRGKAV
jgi:hypothetical protein